VHLALRGRDWPGGPCIGRGRGQYQRYRPRFCNSACRRVTPRPADSPLQRRAMAVCGAGPTRHQDIVDPSDYVSNSRSRPQTPQPTAQAPTAGQPCGARPPATAPRRHRPHRKPPHPPHHNPQARTKAVAPRSQPGHHRCTPLGPPFHSSIIIIPNYYLHSAQTPLIFMFDY
jgi:hypothetical protein